MGSTAVALASVSAGYENQLVFSDLTVTFSKNQITCILGRSGCGKSTLLQLINGMVRPTTGSVALFGKGLDYFNIAHERLSIGYVVQQTGLFPHLTIRKNIILLGQISALPKVQIEQRLNQLMDMAQLPSAALARYPHQLSGGEQQRVGICRALFLNPPVLLMDEPFASLDGTTKEAIFSYIKTFQASEPRTVIWVTHDWDEAESLCDQFILLDKGNISVQGQREELRSLRVTNSIRS